MCTLNDWYVEQGVEPGSPECQRLQKQRKNALRIAGIKPGTPQAVAFLKAHDGKGA